MTSDPLAPPVARPSGKIRHVDPASVPEQTELGAAEVEPIGEPGPHWRMVAGAEELWFAPPSGQAIVLDHEEFEANTTLMMGGRWVYVNMKGISPLSGFQLNGESIALLGKWFSRSYDLHLKGALIKRLRFSTPIGAFSTFMALPILRHSYDVFQLAFGTSLLLLGLVAPRRPHPVFFLGLAFNWFCLAASNARGISRGTLWLIAFVVFSVFCGIGSLRAYGFYKNMRR